MLVPAGGSSTFTHPRCCCRFAGRYRDSHKEPPTDLHPDSEADSSSRRQSLMKMVGLGKLRREPTADRSSLGTEDQEVQPKVAQVKPREPLSGKDQGPRFPTGLVWLGSASSLAQSARGSADVGV